MLGHQSTNNRGKKRRNGREMTVSKRVVWIEDRDGECGCWVVDLYS